MSARGAISSTELSETGIADEMARVLPRRNNYADINFGELLEEARHFGITTRGALRKLLLRHRKQLRAIDREPLDKLHIRIYSKDMGYAVVRDHVRRQFWFSWEAMMRIALELEFGEAYENFANQRDAPNGNRGANTIV